MVTACVAWSFFEIQDLTYIPQEADGFAFDINARYPIEEIIALTDLSREEIEAIPVASQK